MQNQTIKGTHPVLQAIIAAAPRIASSPASALILGETGTGKELLARHLHSLGPRRALPFVRIDCLEVQDIVDGAPQLDTLARQPRHDGLSHLRELIGGGTAFLDQFTALPAATQRGLCLGLGVGQQGAGQRLRVIACGPPCAVTAQHLAPLGADTIEIPMPALRQRRSDIPVLVEHFLTLYAGRHGVAAGPISTEAMVSLW
jgi:DNA-binding NtrC family response regulator